MVDIPESSGCDDIEETSTAEETITLVDTVDDPTLDWVGADPHGIASVYSLHSRQAYTVV